MVDGAATIRLACRADAANIASVHVQSWRETYTGIVPASMLSSLSVDARTQMWNQVIEASLNSGPTAVYVAEIDDEVVGFGSCGMQRTEALRGKGYDGEIGAIYVLAAFQGRAIGKRLLFSMASELYRRNCRAASLWVLRENMRARRFYERYQAQVITERQEALSDAVLCELAYGWPDLEELARLTAHESLSRAPFT